MQRRLGSKNPNAKLTEADVEAIRFRAEVKRQRVKQIKDKMQRLQVELSKAVSSDTLPQLAADFEVSESTIRNVLYRDDVWGHVR